MSALFSIACSEPSHVSVHAQFYVYVCVCMCNLWIDFVILNNKI